MGPPGRLIVLAAAALLVVAAVGVAPVAAQGRFDDVSPGSHDANIEALAEVGVFEGTQCGERLFCPGDAIKRWVMAVWLVRVLDGDDPAGLEDGSRFVDVDDEAWWAAHVERLAELGVTLGCSVETLSYCPDEPVTRGQTASFLARAFMVEPAGEFGFSDIAGGKHASNIDAIAAVGITVGCEVDPLRYYPSSSVTRAHMASFLNRADSLTQQPSETEPDDSRGGGSGGGGSGGGGSISGGSVGGRPVSVQRPRRVTVRISGPSEVKSGSFDVRLQFSVAVATLSPDSVQVSNGTRKSLETSGDSRVWTAHLVPDPGHEGHVVVTVRAGAAGVGATANESASQRFAVDTMAPTLVGAMIEGDELELEFSEELGAVPDAVRADLSVTVRDAVSGIESAPSVQSVSVRGRRLVLALDAAARYGDTVSVTYTPSGSGIEDTAGNAAPAFRDVRVVITGAPTVTLSSSARPWVFGPFDVTIGFSETVTGFTIDGIDVSSNAKLSGFDESGTGYIVTVNPDTDGTVTVSVPADAARDNDGNPNEASAPLTRNVDIRPSAPPDVVLHAGDGRLVAEWGTPHSDGGSPILRYLIQWRIPGQDWSSSGSAMVSSENRAHMITGLENGTTYEVRVAAEDQVGPGHWSAEPSAAPNVVAGAPKNLRATRIHTRLDVSWEAPDDAGGLPVTGYRVHRKTGTRSFGAAGPTFHAASDSPNHLLSGLDNDKVYVIRVTTVSDTTNIASSIIAVTPEPARDYIDRLIGQYENSFPWLTQAWRKHRIEVEIKPLPGFTTGRWVSDHYRVNGFFDLLQGVRLEFEVTSYQNEHNILHELAHQFTSDARVPDVPGPVGIGFLYTSHRVGGNCNAREVYADLLADTVFNARGNYLVNCDEIATDGIPDDESRAVAGSVVRGEIPAWFNDHYQGGDGSLDLDAVWADTKSLGAFDTRAAAYHMRDLFGGFCSLRTANWALDQSGLSDGNPWVDGGCDWRRPQNLAVSSGTGSLTVSFDAPPYETSPSVDQYVVQWRSGSQAYSTVRQAVVSASQQMSHIIDNLTDGIEHYVRVAAVNSAWPSVFVDDDGRSRTAEVSGVPG